MYVEIPEKFVDQFMGVLQEGGVYDLRKFLVFAKKYVFRPVESQFMIKFTRYTSVVQREGIEAEFPFCTYALTPIAQLPKPTDMPERFTDVIGIISGVSDTVQYHHASRSNPSTKRIIHLKDPNGYQISVVLWGETAVEFEADEVIAMGEKEAVVSIFVGGLVKAYDGRRGLSGSAACHWYINEDLHDINVIHNRLRNGSSPVQRIVLQGQTADEVVAQVNLETKTVTELLDLDMFDNRDGRFFCTATLIGLSPAQRWWFSSCTVCHRSSSPVGAVYKCSDPNCSGTDAIPRYRICYKAADDTNEIEFVFFDRVAVASVFYRGSHSASGSASTGGAVQSEDPLLPPTLPSPSTMTSDLSVQRPVNTPTNTGPIDTAATDLFSPRGQAQVTLPGTPASVAKPPPKGITHSGVKTNAKCALMNDKTFAAGLPEDLAGPTDDDVRLADMTNTKKRGGPVLSKVTSPDGGKKPKE